jgi:hypothetical protein
MFQLSQEEFLNLMSQIVISSSKTAVNTDDFDLMSQIPASDWGGRRKLDEHSEQLALVFQALRELVQQKNEHREPVGFKISQRKT